MILGASGGMYISLPFHLSYASFSQLKSAYLPPYAFSKHWPNFKVGAEAFYILDIFIHMNTTIYDHDGNEVFDRKHIAWDYIMEIYFLLDILSTVPLGVSNFI